MARALAVAVLVAAAASFPGATGEEAAPLLLAGGEEGQARKADASAVGASGGAENATEGWRQWLTPREREDLEHQMSHLEKKAKREESYAREDGRREVADMRDEYQHKESHVLHKFEKMANSTATKAKAAPREPPAATEKEEKAHGAGATLLAAEVGVGGAQQQTQELPPTSKQDEELDRELARLQKKAAREESYARGDGQGAVNATRKEYARKEAQLRKDFEHRAAKAAHRSSGHKEEGQEDEADRLQHLLSKLRKKAKHEEAYAREDGKGELKDRQEEFARKEEKLLAKFNETSTSHEGAVAALLLAASDEAGGNVSAAEERERQQEQRAREEHERAVEAERLRQEKLDKALGRLEKKAKKEESYAREDGAEEVKDVQAEYARKEANLRKEFEHESGHGSEGKKNLHSQEDDAERLQHALSKLRKKAKREEAYAREDGPGELKDRKQEFAKKEEKLLAKFNATEPSGQGLAAPVALVEEAGNVSASKAAHEERPAQKSGRATQEVEQKRPQPAQTGEGEAWRHWLTEEQQKELQQKLEHLRKENRVQQTYASEYGSRAVRSQQEDYERKVARVLAGFRSKAEEAAAAGGGRDAGAAGAGGLSAQAFERGTPVAWLAATTVASMIFVLVATGRRRFSTSQVGLQAPLIAEP